MGQRILCLMDASKENAVDNYRPKSSLPLIPGILEINETMQEVNKIIIPGYLQRLGLVLQSHVSGRNYFQSINTWTIAL